MRQTSERIFEPMRTARIVAIEVEPTDELGPEPWAVEWTNDLGSSGTPLRQESRAAARRQHAEAVAARSEPGRGIRRGINGHQSGLSVYAEQPLVRIGIAPIRDDGQD